MDITFDEQKRQRTLRERDLDFRDAAQIFKDLHFEIVDDRRDYGEQRFIVFGELAGRDVVLVWTPRNGTRRIISMRHAHDEEVKSRRNALD